MSVAQRRSCFALFQFDGSCRAHEGSALDGAPADVNVGLHCPDRGPFHRLSSVEPNLQNVPKAPVSLKGGLVVDIRQAFCARPGRLLVAVDYCHIELRMLAHLAGDPTLIAMFGAGVCHLCPGCSSFDQREAPAVGCTGFYRGPQWSLYLGKVKEISDTGFTDELTFWRPAVGSQRTAVMTKQCPVIVLRSRKSESGGVASQVPAVARSGNSGHGALRGCSTGTAGAAMRSLSNCVTIVVTVRTGRSGCFWCRPPFAFALRDGRARQHCRKAVVQEREHHHSCRARARQARVLCCAVWHQPSLRGAAVTRAPDPSGTVCDRVL